MPREYNKSNVTPEDFVRIWQKAKSMDDVVENTGLTARAASVRAHGYRSKGVPLKLFRKIVDWEALAKIAEDIKEEA